MSVVPSKQTVSKCLDHLKLPSSECPSRKVVEVTKKTSGKSSAHRAAETLSNTGQAQTSGDLFAWASHQPKKTQIRNKTTIKANNRTEPATNNMDDVRAQRAKASEADKAQRRSYVSRGLGAIVPRLTREAVGKKASLEADLQIYWREIVGDDFAGSTFPRRIRFDQPSKRINGVLELSIERGYGAIMAHAKGQILDKLNAYYGLGTFRDLKFKEGPLPQPPTNTAQRRVAARPPSPIDLSDPHTRQRLGLNPIPLKESQASGAEKPWAPNPPKRHPLRLTMTDRGGAGVDHQPLADALTYLGASLANQDQ